MKPVFDIRNVTVSFNFCAVRERSLSYRVSNWLKTNPDDAKTYAALSNINLTINQGEMVGIIGRNGSGKSTLLRVFTRVIVPKQGTVVVAKEKTIAPLLELGIGFQPDLSGEENCFLAGSLMGFSNHEIKSKLKGIQEFAELGDFFYEPIKHYSSGMYARLAFTLATDVDPDILLIDEVLGVGDASFAQKSLERINELIQVGTTIIIVSHNMEFLRMQCKRIIWLEQGKIAMDDEPDRVIEAYNKMIFS